MFIVTRRLTLPVYGARPVFFPVHGWPTQHGNTAEQVLTKLSIECATARSSVSAWPCDRGDKRVRWPHTRGSAPISGSNVSPVFSKSSAEGPSNGYYPRFHVTSRLQCERGRFRFGLVFIVLPERFVLSRSIRCVTNAWSIWAHLCSTHPLCTGVYWPALRQ